MKTTFDIFFEELRNQDLLGGNIFDFLKIIDKEVEDCFKTSGDIDWLMQRIDMQFKLTDECKIIVRKYVSEIIDEKNYSRKRM